MTSRKMAQASTHLPPINVPALASKQDLFKSCIAHHSSAKGAALFDNFSQTSADSLEFQPEKM
jgi:hypothetical protein